MRRNANPSNPSLFFKYPILGAVFSFAFVSIASYGILITWSDLQKFPTTSASVSLTSAATQATEEGIWVTLKDTRWDCQSILKTGTGGKYSYTYVALTNKEETVVAVAGSLSGHWSCDQILSLTPSGMLYSSCADCFGDTGKRMNLAKYENATTFLRLCTFCDPKNTIVFLGCNVVMFLTGLVIYPAILLGRKRWIRIYGTAQ